MESMGDGMVDGTSKRGTQCIYEQLGAPGLIYRHAASYTGWDTTPPEPWRSDWYNVREARYLRTAWNSQNRVRSRWYYPADHAYQRGEEQDDSCSPKRKGKNRNKRRARQRASNPDALPDQLAASHEVDNGGSESDHSLSSNGRSLAISTNLDQLDPLLNTDFLRERLPDHMEKAMARGLAGHLKPVVVQRSYQQYDHAYVPGSYRIAGYGNLSSKGAVSQTNLQPTLARPRWTNSLDMSLQRRNAGIEYLAPIDFASLNDASREDKNNTTRQGRRLSNRRHRQASYPIQPEDVYSPTRFGNCLVCLRCPCRYCRESERESACWVLIHPDGNLLSHVCISNLAFPYGPKNSAATQKTNSGRVLCTTRHEFDVGERILQIEQCTKETHRSDSLGIFTVRSISYCTVLRVESCFYASVQHKSNPDPKKRGRKRKIIESPLKQCLGTFSIEQIARIDLRSLDRTGLSFQPIDVAGHPKYGNANSSAKVAILSCADRGRSNIIHHVAMARKLHIQAHRISCLQRITSLAFTNTNPMTLWAAASSYVRPALISDIYSKRPALGHGTSLYTVDLRSNDATFQWSPSAEEFVVEGTHSISSLLTDWRKEHALWASSSSAGKTWEIDGRMMGRVVNFWSLSSISEDSGALLPAMGLHGAGSLLFDPFVDSARGRAEECRPILGIEKSPGSFGLHLYQRPEYRPRFQTNSLQSSIHRYRSSIASSSVFSLPDVSDRVFTCGLSAFDVPQSHLVKEMGNSGSVEATLGVVTMTSRGDLYTHLLSQRRTNKPKKSGLYSRLSVGTTASPVQMPTPSADPLEAPTRYRNMKKLDGGWNLPVSARNHYPIASESINKSLISSRASCRPFQSVALGRLVEYPQERGAAPPGQREDIHGGDRGSSCQQSLSDFQDCFSRGKASTIEKSEAEPRSDINAGILRSIDSLWSEDRFAQHHT